MTGPAGRRMPAALWLTALFAFSRAVILLTVAGRGTDLGVQAGYARQVIAGLVPFRDFFPEYPPLALAFTTLPALLDPSLKWYFPIFRALCVAIDCGVWVVIVRQTRATPARCLLYLLCSTALGPLLYDRIDIVLGALLLAALVALARGADNRFHLALGAAIAFKLIPIVWAPTVLALAWTKSKRAAALGAFLMALPALVSFDAVAVFGGTEFARMFEYHASRGVQIESAPATAEMILMALGVQGEIGLEYGSVNLHTAYERALILSGNALLAALVIGSAVMAARRQLGADGAAYLLCGVLCGALFCSKVLSPQFFIFLLPLLVILPAPAARGAAVAEWALVVLLYLLTGLIFPWLYKDLMELRPGAQALLFVRNVGLGGLTVWLLRRATVVQVAPAPH